MRSTGSIDLAQIRKEYSNSGIAVGRRMWRGTAYRLNVLSDAIFWGKLCLGGGKLHLKAFLLQI